MTDYEIELLKTNAGLAKVLVESMDLAGEARSIARRLRRMIGGCTAEELRALHAEAPWLDGYIEAELMRAVEQELAE